MAAAVVVALVLGGAAVADRLRGGASSPAAVGDRVVSALDREDLTALARLVEPDERAALLRLGDSLSARLGDLDLPAEVGGGPRVPTAHAFDDYARTAAAGAVRRLVGTVEERALDLLASRHSPNAQGAVRA